LKFTLLPAAYLLQERVPFQYLLAAAHWRDLVLAVGPGILVPRPETELMIDLAAAALESNPALVTLPWADLGTGSGALAIAAAQLLQQHAKDTPQTPSASSDDHNHQQQQQAASVEAAAAQPRVYAVDLSPTAVAYATANAAACGVQGAVQAVQGSWFKPLQHLKGQLGGVLSNPPYIPRSDIESGLQAEVALHEPMTALDGGPGEGMDSLQVRLRYEGLGPQLCGVLLCAERTKWLQNFMGPRHQFGMCCISYRVGYREAYSLMLAKAGTSFIGCCRLAKVYAPARLPNAFEGCTAVHLASAIVAALPGHLSASSDHAGAWRLHCARGV
jgi:HemK-like putative methylase